VQRLDCQDNLIGTVELNYDHRIPDDVLSKATLRGKEYAWPISAVEEAIEAARENGMANIGGEVQFRLPDKIYELYWIGFDSDPQHEGETWNAYVVRSAEEVLNRFRQLRSQTDFIKEGTEYYKPLEQMHKEGVSLDQYLCFVLDFEEDQCKR